MGFGGITQGGARGGHEARAIRAVARQPYCCTSETRKSCFSIVKHCSVIVISLQVWPEVQPVCIYEELG